MMIVYIIMAVAVCIILLCDAIRTQHELSVGDVLYCAVSGVLWPIMLFIALLMFISNGLAYLTSIKIYKKR